MDPSYLLNNGDSTYQTKARSGKKRALKQLRVCFGSGISPIDRKMRQGAGRVFGSF
jgi:hypothetical protein